MIIIEAQEVTEEEPYIWVLLLLQEEVMVADSQAAEVLEAALVASAAVHSVEVVPAVAGSLCDYLSPHSLLFLNGDIASAGNYVEDTFVHYVLESLGTLPAGLPVHFARGNHEGRGNNTQLVSDVFPNSDPAPFYYTFRQGPVAFIVLDAGETGHSRSILYSGTPVYEDYINEQIKWARDAVQEPLFSTAPVKICLLHVPMIDHQENILINISLQSPFLQKIQLHFLPSKSHLNSLNRIENLVLNNSTDSGNLDFACISSGLDSYTKLN